MARLLEKPQLGHPPAQQWQEPDIFDYGVERTLVVQPNILVDLFVKNGFHAEQSCLIISANGYPTYLAQRLPELVKKNKNISIFLLHDFSPTGSTVVNRFLAPHKELLKNARILDVGLFQKDVKQINVFKRLQTAADTRLAEKDRF
jgi:DNA topoisomerase VI subunit A